MEGPVVWSAGRGLVGVVDRRSGGVEAAAKIGSPVDQYQAVRSRANLPAAVVSWMAVAVVMVGLVQNLEEDGPVWSGHPVYERGAAAAYDSSPVL